MARTHGRLENMSQEMANSESQPDKGHSETAGSDSGGVKWRAARLFERARAGTGERVWTDERAGTGERVGVGERAGTGERVGVGE
ncbi:MAG: hypothetical protein LBJ61_02630, partial [Deltaproteobacteria bacterium]|nr:hypothetical protein [Deltaproteobacteria bacterium]